MVKTTVLGLLAAVQSVADRVADALAGVGAVGAGCIVLALCLHVGAQAARGLGWHRALAACWPDVGRRRACAWYVCGAGLTGVLSARGGDAVRLALARRELPGSTWPALAGTAVVEAAAQLVVGLPTLALAVAIGVDAARPPSPVLVAGIAAAVAIGAILAVRSRRARGLLEELVRGCSALRHPRRDMSRIVGWQLAGRLLRFAAVGCFLHAFGLPDSLAAVVTVGVVYGSANVVPIPGAGTAASAGALLV